MLRSGPLPPPKIVLGSKTQHWLCSWGPTACQELTQGAWCNCPDPPSSRKPPGKKPAVPPQSLTFPFPCPHSGPLGPGSAATSLAGKHPHTLTLSPTSVPGWGQQVPLSSSLLSPSARGKLLQLLWRPFSSSKHLGLSPPLFSASLLLFLLWHMHFHSLQLP